MGKNILCWRCKARDPQFVALCQTCQARCELPRNRDPVTTPSSMSQASIKKAAKPGWFQVLAERSWPLGWLLLSAILGEVMWRVLH